MATDTKTQLSLLFQLRQELGMPINTIIGYSEIIIEELAEIEQNITYLSGLETIHECGVELLASMNTFLNPTYLSDSQWDLETIVRNPNLQTELEKPTKLVINHCQQLIAITKEDFIIELEKINSAANQLLQEIKGLIETPLQAVELPESFSYQTRTPSILDQLEIDISAKSLLTKQYKILVVDDSSTNREILAAQVAAQNYSVSTAADGKQAIQMIQTGSFDLILLDIIMPEVDGYEVLRWIRNSPWQNIPTIMISALDQIDSVVKCIEMGAEDYLAKPFNPILLEARLSACLEQKRLRDLESSYTRQLAKANQKISKFNNSLKVENNRLSGELGFTQRLQKMLLPTKQELQKIQTLDISGFMEPAAEVGGDYYDVLEHQGRVIIGIGDVSGHGLESGVLMLMVQTAVRTLIENNETDPKQLFEVLNQTIYKNLQRIGSDKNLSLCLIDYQEGNLKITGQHEEVLIVRTNGKIERIDTVDLGFPIGLESSIADFVCQTQITLHPEEVAILYTDGITEAENCQGLHYGIERLCSIAKRSWQNSADQIRQTVIQDLKSHIGSNQVYDDITLVVLKRK